MFWGVEAVYYGIVQVENVRQACSILLLNLPRGPYPHYTLTNLLPVTRASLGLTTQHELFCISKTSHLFSKW